MLSASSIKNAEASMPVQWRSTAVEFFSQDRLAIGNMEIDHA
jgi:hypothetical protein